MHEELHLTLKTLDGESTIDGEEAEVLHEQVVAFDTLIMNLQRGDTVPIHRIETAFGTTRESRNFPLRMLATKNMIQRAFLRRDPPCHVTIAIDSDVGVIVLNPTDAAVYNEKSGAAARRKQRKAFVRQQDVPRGEIAASVRDRYDRDLALQGRVVESMDREVRRKKMPEPKPVERKTPAK